MGKSKATETVKKEIIVEHVPWISNRELYIPTNGAAKDFFEYGALRKAKKHFVFEDLVLFHSRGWKIKYFGRKSKRLHILNAEYLGEDMPE